MSFTTRWLSVPLALLVAACATTDNPATRPPPTVDTGTITGSQSDPHNRAKIRTELASLYFSRGSMGIALEELRQAVAADPSYPAAHSMFGLVYMALKENARAEASFQRALELSPGDPDVNHNYGWFLCQTGREDGAIEYFLRAIRNPLYRQPWRSYSAAGVCLTRKDRLKEAEEMVQRALQLRPDDPVPLLQMGEIRYRQGQFVEARAFVLRFNRLTGGSPESLWLALRIERKLGERLAEASYANQLRRRFPSSQEYQQLQRGDYD